MITERDLQEAIAECEGQRHPNASTCIKLAAFLIIREHMFGEPKSYSYASDMPTLARVEYQSGTEFSDAIEGKPVDDVLEVMDELMSTLSIINRGLYDSVLRKIK